MQFKQINKSVLHLEGENSLVCINLRKVRFVQSSLDFPYPHKRLLSRSFIVLGVIITIINVVKLLFIIGYLSLSAISAGHILMFVVLEICAVIFTIAGIRGLRECRKYKRSFTADTHKIHLIFEDFSTKTFAAGNSKDTRLVLNRLLRALDCIN